MEIYDALVLSLPARHATLRVRVWRALKETGCGVLRDGVYLLPKGSAGAPLLAKMQAEIAGAGGTAQVVEITAKSEGEAAELRKLFDRSAEYGALLRDLETLRSSFSRVGAAKARGAVERARRSAQRLTEIDFFPGEARRQAAEALERLTRDFQRAFPKGEPRQSRRSVRQLDPAAYRRRLWATRKNLWVDRMASAWLIRRFIDREARFVWLDHPRDRPKKALGFDFDGAQFTHVDGRVTFEVLAATFGLEHDEALVLIGKSVHYLDVGGIPVPDAKGLETLLKGAKEKAKDDDALLAEASRIFDLLYSAYSRPAE
ncbi:MAG: chromate resistance protein ChrB domain-containing protein [Clostridia bacterium]